MSASRHFLDTNVIAYAFDESEPRKQKIARHLIHTHAAHIVVSTQVLIELHSVCISKLGLTHENASTIVDTAANFHVVPADRNLILDAVALADRERVSVFDAAIVCAAERAECSQILTEDAKLTRMTSAVPAADPFA